MQFGVGQLSDGFLHLQASELHGHFHIKISCWSPGVGVMGDSQGCGFESQPV